LELAREASEVELLVDQEVQEVQEASELEASEDPVESDNLALLEPFLSDLDKQVRLELEEDKASAPEESAALAGVDLEESEVKQASRDLVREESGKEAPQHPIPLGKVKPSREEQQSASFPEE
jgi:hypothetical protein